MSARILLRTTSALAITAIGIALPAGAAFAQGPALEEITVTARRKEESLMQVPIAITAMTAEALESRGLRSIQEISEFTPGLFSQVQGNGRVDRSSRRLTFRGLSVNVGATFINGAPYAGSGAPDVSDVERVEVLKGPQSVYFGRSTFSGAVNYVTKEPSTEEFSGRVEAEAYSYGGFDGSVGLGGPIVRDKLGVRVNVRRFHFDGQYKNGGPANNGGKLGEQDTKSASIALAATPNDKLKIHAFYSFTEDEDGTPVEASIKPGGLSALFNCNLGGTGGPWFCGELPDLKAIDKRNISVYDVMDPLMRRELIDNVRNYPVLFDTRWMEHVGFRRQVHNLHLRADYEFESGWSVSGIAAYDYTKSQSIVDQTYRDASGLRNPNAVPAVGATPWHQFTLMMQGITHDWSLEGRVASPQEARLRGTVGTSLFSSLVPGGVNYGISIAGRSTQPSTKSTVFTPAIFGGLYFDATDQITVSAEARYQWDRIGQQQLFPWTNASPNPRFKDTFKSFSPRVTLDYKIAQDSLAYATWSRGYRQGGFNGALAALDQGSRNQVATLGSNTTFKQEKLDNFEIGHKGTWLDNRLRTTVAAYYMTWRDGQVSNTAFFTRPDGTTGNVTVVANRGKVDLKGLEIEADFAVTEGLTVSATLDYSDAKVKDYIYTPDGLKIRNSTNVNGNRMEQSPTWSWTISPTYTATLTGDWEWFTRLDYKHRGRIYFDATNVGWLAPRDLINLRAGVNNDNLRIEFYVNNLFNDLSLTEAVRGNDTVYGVNPTPGLGCPPCYTAALPPTTGGGSILNELRIGLPVKRTFGVKASYNF